MLLPTLLSLLFLTNSSSRNAPKATNRMDSRIIGGTEAQADRWPFLAEILINHGHHCGGVVYDRWHVLTAAHCLVDDDTMKLEKAADLSVYLGHVNITVKDPDYVFGVDLVIPHRYYDPETVRYDIGLLRLSDPIDFGHQHLRVRCICEPEPVEKVDGAHCIALGWGSTQAWPVVDSPVLLETEIPLLSSTQCANGSSVYNSHWNVCAANSVGGKDTCAGDSGGPLVCPVLGTSPPVYTLVGITSYGLGNCGDVDVYGYYTRVDRLLYWIESNVAAMETQ